MSRLEYKNTLVFLFQSLTLCKNSLEFCLRLLYLYSSPKMSNPEFWNPRRIIRVLKSD